MRGDTFSLALKLALMEEAQAWREKGDYGGRLMDFGRESRGGAGFVMVF